MLTSDTIQRTIGTTKQHGAKNAVFYTLFSKKATPPFSPTDCTQTISAKNPCLSFTGKERDEETGYGYFGARYMDHELTAMWLSVDPMADKYPSISPYAYCAWNPVKLVDPDGREVEYASFKDRLTVFFERLFNKDFRIRYDDLKASQETYVFKGHKKIGEKGGEVTTDGDKIYINYNTWVNEEQGTNRWVNLRHETEHAVQFEYGENGFDKEKSPFGTWEESCVNFDLMDEVNARDIGYSGFRLNSSAQKNVRNSWIAYGESNQKKMDHLKNDKKKAYKYLSYTRQNNDNKTKVKSSTQYMLPHRDRPSKYFK